MPSPTGPPAPPSGLFQPYVVAYGTASEPQAVAIGDVTGDALNDVVMVTASFGTDPDNHQLFVFRQLAGGTLAPPVRYATGGTHSHPAYSVAIGDVNGDGRNDAVIGNYGAAVGVFYQNTSGGLGAVVLHATPDSKCVRIADLNDDGRLDIVGLTPALDSVSVLVQRQDGTLAPPVAYAAPAAGYNDLEVGDLNSDGLTDVIVMSGEEYPTSPNLSVLYQQSTGSLAALTSRWIEPRRATNGIGIGDVNGDGRNDIVTGSDSPEDLALFFQNPDGTLAATASILPTYGGSKPVEVADLNGDLLDDVVVVHSGYLALGVYLQSPGGTLGPETLDPIPWGQNLNPHGLAVGDLNDDAAPDVAIADHDFGLIVLRHVPMARLPQRYHAVTPCRLLDTRITARPMAANTYRTFKATGACGIPADARSVAINVTAVNPGAVGHYRVYPAGSSIPLASTINFAPGRTRANSAVIPLGPRGQITVRCDMAAGSTASAHLVIDVGGYFK
jgi:hypothetical protein